MTDRDRETLALRWLQDKDNILGDKPVVLAQRVYISGLRGQRRCTSHPSLCGHVVRGLVRLGILTLQSESAGVAVYVRAGTGEPKAAWNGGIL